MELDLQVSPEEIMSREVELDLQVSPEEIMSREVSLAAKVGLLSLRVVPQQQCNGHCPCDSAQARQLKQQLRSALVWWRSTVSPVFFGRYPWSSFHPFIPVPNKPSHFCGRKAKWSSVNGMICNLRQPPDCGVIA